ncbi:15609_t:CDS:2, partial [Racocetra persica]
ENICDVSKLKETCKEVQDTKSIFGNNKDKNKIFDMCDKILKDPKYDNGIIPEPLTVNQKKFIKQFESQLFTHLKTVGAYAISFESSKKPFLNIKIEGMERLEYPFADFIRTYYDIDYDNTEGISYNQLKTIILATKIE